jgi:hypothetical protein
LSAYPLGFSTRTASLNPRLQNDKFESDMARSKPHTKAIRGELKMVPFKDRGAGQSAERAERVTLPVLLGVVMLAGCIYSDVTILPDTFRQIRTVRFLEAPATVTSAQLVRKHRSRIPEAQFVYHYSVDGQQYEGRVCSFLESSVSYGVQAARYLRAFPENSSRPCFYDAAEPQNAVLVKGLQPHHFGFLIALTSFHFLTVIALLSPWAYLKEKERVRPAGWRKNAPEGMECVCLSTDDPSKIFALGIILSASAAFILGIAQTVVHPLAIFISGLIAAEAIRRRSSRRNEAGKNDLCLNLRERAISGPFGQFSFDTIDMIILDSVRIPGHRSSTLEWRLFFRTKDGEEHLLRQSPSRTSLVRLGEWLRHRLSDQSAKGR